MESLNGPLVPDLSSVLTARPVHPQVVFRKLNSSAGVIEEMTGVRIVRVVQKLCAGLHCPLRFCDELITLDKGAMSTHSTARLSFVTPRHARTATCQCEGTLPRPAPAAPLSGRSGVLSVACFHSR